MKGMRELRIYVKDVAWELVYSYVVKLYDGFSSFSLVAFSPFYSVRTFLEKVRHCAFFEGRKILL